MNESQKKRYSKLNTYKYRLIRRATTAEIKFKELLERYGLKYRFQKGIFTRDPLTGKKRFRILDFYVSKCRTGIEIDGGYHNTEVGKYRDEYRTLELKQARRSIRIYRFSNEQVLEESKVVLNALDDLRDAQLYRERHPGSKHAEVNFLLNR